VAVVVRVMRRMRSVARQLSQEGIIVSSGKAKLISSSGDEAATSFFIIIHLLTCAYIVWVISPPAPFPFRQNLFCTFLQFH
jgi:hypothetical protein